MKRIVSAVLAAMLLVCCLSACSSAPASTSNGSSATPFKIGGIGPLTGDAAIYGQSVMNGAKIAVEEINAKGGVQRL